MTPADAASAVQDVERRKAQNDLAARDMALYDQRVEEGEIAADPDLVARLIAMSKIRNPRGLRLDEAALVVLSRQPDEVSKLPSPVDNILADNGYRNDATSP